jgi:hypothetical chaperone protein
MRIGLDFGTTNSGAALYDGRRVRLIPLDPADQVPTVMRSVLYVTREHQVLMGREAIETYYRQNIGRPSRLVRQRVGEIEITQADVGSIKGYPTGPSTFVMDVYALVDELTPGRLLRSLKSGLAGDFAGTTIFGRFYPLEELIARFLREVRLRVEREIGAPVGPFRRKRERDRRSARGGAASRGGPGGGLSGGGLRAGTGGGRSPLRVGDGQAG